jgi:hypothetical protein
VPHSPHRRCHKKENLRELLGDDFPQDKIRAIIDEADLTDDHQISYPEFLALWEDGPGTARSEEQSGTLSPSSGSTYSHNSQPETVEKKNLRADSNAESNTLARSNFVEGKKLSERKALDVLEIDAFHAQHVILNEMEEIVEDPAEEVEYTDDLVCTGFPSVPQEITKLDDCFRMSEISGSSNGGRPSASYDSGVEIAVPRLSADI